MSCDSELHDMSFGAIMKATREEARQSAAADVWCAVAALIRAGASTSDIAIFAMQAEADLRKSLKES